MAEFNILNSRKRAIIALIHSIAFCVLACVQLAMNQHPTSLVSSPHSAGPIAMTAIYFIVTAVLLILVGFSRGAMERMYFAFCSTSAGVGLLRVVFGDPTEHLGACVRVLMLMAAVVVGCGILRAHGGQERTRVATESVSA